jgi:glycosyltransferase involved in cell wall biosynthesis
MKILHAILSRGFYGSERYCAELAAEQARGGHQVEVLIEDATSDCARAMHQAADLAASAGKGTMRIVTIPGWLPSALHRPMARRAIARFAPDVVHTHLTPAARRVGAAAQKLGVPHISTLLIHYNEREHAPCDGLIAVARSQLKLIPEKVHHKTAVIWPWLPTGVHDAIAHVTAADVETVRRQWRATANDVVIGSVGRLVPEKGMDVLVRAFRRAFARGDEPVRLVIVGQGPMQDEMQGLIAGDARIILAGAQSGIATFYGAFDVFVSASRFEPFGIAIMEAMAARLPLVLTRTDGPTEFVKPDQALWADVADDASLATQLVTAAARGRQRISYDLEAFSQTNAMRAIVAYYEKVMARMGA